VDKPPAVVPPTGTCIRTEQAHHSRKVVRLFDVSGFGCAGRSEKQSKE
jgi:hypothetical protein